MTYEKLAMLWSLKVRACWLSQPLLVRILLLLPLVIKKYSTERLIERKWFALKLNQTETKNVKSYFHEDKEFLANSHFQPYYKRRREKYPNGNCPNAVFKFLKDSSTKKLVLHLFGQYLASAFAAYCICDLPCISTRWVWFSLLSTN